MLSTNDSAQRTKVELRLECQKLPDLDTLSKSDPQIKVEMKRKGSEWVRVGQTEVIKDCLNPKFSTPIVVDYYFQELQELRFTIIDIDSHNKFDLLGTLGQVVGAPGNTSVQRINHKYKNKSFLIIIAEEVQSEDKKDVFFTVRGQHLDKKDLFGKSDPYLEISRPSSQSRDCWSLVHRTEVIKKTLDPKWKSFDIPMHRLNRGKMDLELKFDVYDWNASGKADFIGSFVTTLNQLQKKSEWPLINPKKKSKSRYQNSGVLHFSIRIEKAYSFLDYIMGGTEINLMVAIDFTGSNGAPTDPKSLHYVQKGRLNDYESVISSVGSILLAYDSDGAVPTFGFGAKLSGSFAKAAQHTIPHSRGGKVAQCFSLNGNPDDPEIKGGLAGILDCYHSVVASKDIKFYGPTTFAHIVQEATAAHSTAGDVQAFVILLIITDGVIPQEHDFVETKEAIIEASNLPMAIVIVGVGEENFDQMEELDGDDDMLNSRGKVAAADIVQFVPYRQFHNKPDALAANVLEEIPEQLVSYMKRNKIKPRPPPSAEEIAKMQQQSMSNPYSTNSTTSTTVHMPPEKPSRSSKKGGASAKSSVHVPPDMSAYLMAPHHQTQTDPAAFPSNNPFASGGPTPAPAPAPAPAPYPYPYPPPGGYPYPPPGQQPPAPYGYPSNALPLNPGTSTNPTNYPYPSYGGWYPPPPGPGGYPYPPYPYPYSVQQLPPDQQDSNTNPAGTGAGPDQANASHPSNAPAPGSHPYPYPPPQYGVPPPYPGAYDPNQPPPGTGTNSNPTPYASYPPPYPYPPPQNQNPNQDKI